MELKKKKIRKAQFWKIVEEKSSPSILLQHFYQRNHTPTAAYSKKNKLPRHLLSSS